MTIVSSKPTRPGIKPEKDICLRVLPWKICKGISKREHIIMPQQYQKKKAAIKHYT